MSKTQIEDRLKTSFRDPSGQLVESSDSIKRHIYDQPEDFLSLLRSSLAVDELIKRGDLISYEVISSSKSLVLEHPKIWFPSYPYEWVYEMLHDAAQLTIQLSLYLLDEGLGLKDATPYNILFEGGRPIFVDLASIERRRATDPIWRPYAQFLSTFLLPLLMNKEYGLSFSEAFLSNLEGLSSEYCARFGKKWKSSFISLIYLPRLLARFAKKSTYKEHSCSSKELAQFVLHGRLKKNMKLLRKLSPVASSSHWSKYMSGLSHYGDESFPKKERFVKKALASIEPKTLLDVGCNTGHFSKLAAEQQIKVVAIDSDQAAVSSLYRDAKQSKLDILPLNVNLTRPSPAVGWKNRETWSFLERAHEKFDCVLMLAVIHHMLVTDRIPMKEIAAQLAALTKEWAIVEFVAPSDPMFKELERGRDLYSHLTFEFFKSCFSEFFSFETDSENSYHPTRVLVLLKKL